MDPGPDHWTIDVETAHHDDMKFGVLRVPQLHARGMNPLRTRRVLLSKDEFPDPTYAEEFACVFSVAIHGGMPTRAVHCL